MTQKGKLAVLFVLLLALAILNVRRGSAPPARGASGKGTSVSTSGENRIPDVRLRLDLLERPRQRAEVTRNIFEYRRTEVAPPASPVPAAAREPRPEPVAPAPLRFYGFAEDGQSRQKRAFLTDGEEIFIASEGDTLLRRYRVAKVRAMSVELVDLASGQQWVVPLEQP